MKKDEKKEKDDSSEDSSSDDDDGELHPLLQAHRRPVTKPQPKPKEPSPKKVIGAIEEKKPAAKPEDVAKLYLSMKYKSNPEPVLETFTPRPPVSKEDNTPQQMHPEYREQQQQFNQHQPFGSFPLPPPPPPANVYSQHLTEHHHNVPFNRPTMHVPQPPQRIMQPPIGDNFRSHPHAQPPPFMYNANHSQRQPMDGRLQGGFQPFHRPPTRNMMAPIRGFYNLSRLLNLLNSNYRN